MKTKTTIELPEYPWLKDESTILMTRRDLCRITLAIRVRDGIPDNAFATALGYRPTSGAGNRRWFCVDEDKWCAPSRENCKKIVGFIKHYYPEIINPKMKVVFFMEDSEDDE